MAARRRKKRRKRPFGHSLREQNFLFICGKNKLRSPTAEHVFADVPGVNTLSAGINRDAEEPLSDELVEWADYIFVMERSHRAKVQKNHRAALKDKRVVTLNIPDEFSFMDPELVTLLKSKMQRWIPDR